jgi:flotillin
MSPLLAVLALFLFAGAVVVLLVHLMWKVAEPNEAMIVSGLHAHDFAGATEGGLGFRIVVGKGTFVVPGLQTVRRLSLDLHEAEVTLRCVTHQGIPIGVRAVVIYKIADDYQSIANAARRFLDQQQQIDQKVHTVFAGHLRSIVGSITLEDMIRDREKLTEQTRHSSADEMQKLGLTIDSLQIQEIEDETGYIENLARPESARVHKEARIAQAFSDREATEREQEAEALKANARSTSEISQAQAMAKAARARSEAEQAGPLAAATARQQVVVAEAKIAELEAQKREGELIATVKKPADAEAYKRRQGCGARRARGRRHRPAGRPEPAGDRRSRLEGVRQHRPAHRRERRRRRRGALQPGARDRRSRRSDPARRAPPARCRPPAAEGGDERARVRTRPDRRVVLTQR